MNTGAVAMLAAVLCAAGAAVAEPPAGAPATPVAPVTVTAAPSRPHERFVRSLRFVGSHGATARSGQVARWDISVCPIAVGLSPEANRFVAGRVLALAHRVGAPAFGRGRCRPNVEILFTDQPQALLDLVARKRNELLGFHYVSQLRRITAVTRPIQGWWLTATKSSAAPGGVDAAQAGANLDAGGVLDLEFNRMPGGCAGSAFSQCLTSVFANILIVADVDALNGRKLAPVADYIAMMALSQPGDLDACDAMPSLYDMLAKCAGPDAPQSVTTGDVAYLKALYGGRNDLKAWIARDEAANRMARSLAAPR